jgi:UDP-glucose 4-epimerase
MPVVIARLANLYGPGQDLNKLQGLVSKLALTSITQETLIMFVPLDTLRDFIHAEDAATRALHWMSVAAPGVQTRVIGSGQATSLGYVINQMRAVTRRPLPIAYGMHHTAAVQSPDLRLRPDEDEDICRMQLRSLPIGLKEIFEDMLSRHQGIMGTSGAS